MESILLLLCPLADVVEKTRRDEKLLQFADFIDTEKAATKTFEEFQDQMNTHLVEEKFRKYFGYLARRDFWAKLRLRFWILVGYVDFLAKFGAKFDFRV